MTEDPAVTEDAARPGEAESAGDAGARDAGRPDESVRGVLVAVDGSEQSERALAFAAHEARARGVTLTIAHCYYWPSSGLAAMGAIGFLMEALERDSSEILANAANTVRVLEPELSVNTVSRLGPPIPTLVEMSAAADLVVVGSRGLGGFTGMLLGSVGMGLVAGAACPVVVVRGEHLPSAGDPVVAGVAGGPTGDAVLSEAFGAAQRRGCPLVVLHCWQDPTADVRAARGREPGAEEQSWRRNATEALAAQVARVGAGFPTVPVESVVQPGRPAAALLARATGAQLLVVGTRGRGEIKGLLLGSTSRAVVQHATCPVLVVR